MSDVSSTTSARFDQMSSTTAQPISLFALAAWIGVVAGCGDTGPQRYTRSGQVTFNGQPVAKGEIVFMPDRDKGGSGPGATVTFEGGKYQTPGDMGTFSGPHIVMVSGFDGQPPNNEVPELVHPWGNTLFVRHWVEIDFPDKSSVHDIHVRQ